MSTNNTPPTNSFSLTLNSPHLGEFDLGGVLYHARYFHIYEHLREEYLRQQHIPYHGYVQNNQHLPITETQQKFLHPLRYGDTIQAHLWITNLKRASFQANYALYHQTNLLNLASTKHAFVQIENNSFQVELLPDALHTALTLIAG